MAKEVTVNGKGTHGLGRVASVKLVARRWKKNALTFIAESEEGKRDQIRRQSKEEGGLDDLARPVARRTSWIPFRGAHVRKPAQATRVSAQEPFNASSQPLPLGTKTQDVQIDDDPPTPPPRWRPLTTVMQQPNDARQGTAPAAEERTGFIPIGSGQRRKGRNSRERPPEPAPTETSDLTKEENSTQNKSIELVRTFSFSLVKGALDSPKTVVSAVSASNDAIMGAVSTAGAQVQAAGAQVQDAPKAFAGAVKAEFQGGKAAGAATDANGRAEGAGAATDADDGTQEGTTKAPAPAEDDPAQGDPAEDDPVSPFHPKRLARGATKVVVEAPINVVEAPLQGVAPKQMAAGASAGSTALTRASTGTLMHMNEEAWGLAFQNSGKGFQEIGSFLTGLGATRTLRVATDPLGKVGGQMQGAAAAVGEGFAHAGHAKRRVQTRVK